MRADYSVHYSAFRTRVVFSPSGYNEQVKMAAKHDRSDGGKLAAARAKSSLAMSSPRLLLGWPSTARWHADRQLGHVIFGMMYFRVVFGPSSRSGVYTRTYIYTPALISLPTQPARHHSINCQRDGQNATLKPRSYPRAKLFTSH